MNSSRNLEKYSSSVANYADFLPTFAHRRNEAFPLSEEGQTLAAFSANIKEKIAQMKGTVRANIHPGDRVKIVLKKDQKTGLLTEGVVQDILTSAPKHHRGIKVRLEDGQIGRVQEILE